MHKLLGLLLVLVGMSWCSIFLLGWLSAQTQPAEIKPLPSFSPAQLPPRLLDLPKWTVVEVVSGDLLRVVQTDQTQTHLVQLACIDLTNNAKQAKYAGDRLRALVYHSQQQVQLDVLQVTAEGTMLAEVWTTEFQQPKLVQVELARKGYVTLHQKTGLVCPSQKAIRAAHAIYQRRQQLNLIRF
jgi:endonuclease YncB( thermonuclease family)